jgi:hypothetical protein
MGSRSSTASSRSGVDHVAAGLADFGKWRAISGGRCRAGARSSSYAEFGLAGPQIPGVERVACWLEEQRPASPPRILHGDYHLANACSATTRPRSRRSSTGTLYDRDPCSTSATRHLAARRGTDTRLDHRHTVGGLPHCRRADLAYRRGTSRLSALAWYRCSPATSSGSSRGHARARLRGQAPKATGDILHATTVALFERALRLVAEA